MKQILYCLLLSLLVSACNSGSSALREGDLLFQDLNSGDLLSDAIEKVTVNAENSPSRSFSHCALVVKIADTLDVVEAIGDSVQITSPSIFYARSGEVYNPRKPGETQRIAVRRLKSEYKKYIGEAEKFALKQCGQPYDDEYLIDNGKWYCSELVTEAFNSATKADSFAFFRYEPMTFKDPATGELLQTWINYYKRLNGGDGMPVPEGKPGNNPNSLFRMADSVTVEVK